jgi:hypothetical protein
MKSSFDALATSGWLAADCARRSVKGIDHYHEEDAEGRGTFRIIATINASMSVGTEVYSLIIHI